MMRDRFLVARLRGAVSENISLPLDGFSVPEAHGVHAILPHRMPGRRRAHKRAFAHPQAPGAE